MYYIKCSNCNTQVVDIEMDVRVFGDDTFSFDIRGGECECTSEAIDAKLWQIKDMDD